MQLFRNTALITCEETGIVYALAKAFPGGRKHGRRRNGFGKLTTDAGSAKAEFLHPSDDVSFYGGRGVKPAPFTMAWEARMLASFSVVPMGGGEGVKEIIAEVLSIVDSSGLPYQLGPMHTVIEGEPERYGSLQKYWMVGRRPERTVRKSVVRGRLQWSGDDQDRPSIYPPIESSVGNVYREFSRNVYT